MRATLVFATLAVLASCASNAPDPNRVAYLSPLGAPAPPVTYRDLTRPAPPVFSYPAPDSTIERTALPPSPANTADLAPDQAEPSLTTPASTPTETDDIDTGPSDRVDMPAEPIPDQGSTANEGDTTPLETETPASPDPEPESENRLVNLLSDTLEAYRAPDSGPVELVTPCADNTLRLAPGTLRNSLRDALSDQCDIELDKWRVGDRDTIFDFPLPSGMEVDLTTEDLSDVSEMLDSKFSLESSFDAQSRRFSVTGAAQ